MYNIQDHNIVELYLYNIPFYLEMVSENVISTFGQPIAIEVSKFNDKSTLIGCIYHSIINFFEK